MFGRQSFSQRIGINPRKAIQIDDMDKELRTVLWNLYYNTDQKLNDLLYSTNYEFRKLIWERHFIKLSNMYSLENLRNEIGNCILYKEWYEVYDFFEAFILIFSIIDVFQTEYKDFCKEFNRELEQQKAGFKLIEGKITKITDEEEIKCIEETLDSTRSKFKGVYEHLKTALGMFSDRINPDYRNSIKESISAVEAICIIICNKPKATLGEALKLIEKQGKIELHGALKSGFSSLYGYTSDKNGIRHALLDEQKISFEEAKYMLVSCSSFINYLIGISNKAGIFK